MPKYLKAKVVMDLSEYQSHIGYMKGMGKIGEEMLAGYISRLETIDANKLRLIRRMRGLLETMNRAVVKSAGLGMNG